QRRAVGNYDRRVIFSGQPGRQRLDVDPPAAVALLPIRALLVVCGPRGAAGETGDADAEHAPPRHDAFHSISPVPWPAPSAAASRVKRIAPAMPADCGSLPAINCS